MSPRQLHLGRGMLHAAMSSVLSVSQLRISSGVAILSLVTATHLGCAGASSQMSDVPATSSVGEVDRSPNGSADPPAKTEGATKPRAGFFVVKPSQSIYVEVAMVGADSAATGRRYETLISKLKAESVAVTPIDTLGTDGKTARLVQFRLLSAAPIRGYGVTVHLTMSGSASSREPISTGKTNAAELALKNVCVCILWVDPDAVPAAAAVVKQVRQTNPRGDSLAFVVQTTGARTADLLSQLGLPSATPIVSSVSGIDAIAAAVDRVRPEIEKASVDATGRPF
jgi:hypothetical protein